MDDNLTNAVTAGVAAWTSKVLATLDGEKAEIVNRVIYNDPDADLRVVFKLKAGVVLLEAEKGDRKFGLYAADVEPMRPRTGFAEPESKGMH
jgi:hypothetical protein